ncbi:hypothetical protein [Bifidobacterium oedipodis]|uniref:Uncharacterized protein n=1 Tax=Bifidobacterium oedipodis TaxID=2675322 RepID=A0A7Y0HU70_9BIFI|nr:hypothetical protein [Bifidobacterium sp. DSM 109957]NMM94429.1 hypothetical protein [Bifidobacterium sp. DSM 109957]
MWVCSQSGEPIDCGLGLKAEDFTVRMHMRHGGGVPAVSVHLGPRDQPHVTLSSLNSVRLT